MSIYDKIITFYKKMLIGCRRQRKSLATSFKSSTTKRVINSCCSMKLSSATEIKKKELHDNLKVLVKKYINAPEKLIQYLKTQGITIYKVPFAEKILNSMGEEEGFLIPLKGYKAIILNLIIGACCENKFKLSAKTKEMMVFNKGIIEIYTIARAAYKYYGFKNQLPGYDYKSQNVFKRAYSKRNKETSPFASCSIQDMYACKEAIARDIESINFTIELSTEYENAKRALKKVQEKSASI